ncbi:MAG: glycoside hydrolase [Nitrospiraceae bacterium]|nr:glycoside hydrolase [Nitrospiraceae bacterium]
MSAYPLSVAFLWHMHQPYYKDPFTGINVLPWVRLHGTKDYLDMVKELEDFPAIRQTVNVVPSLLQQLVEYTENRASDRFLEMTLINPSDMTDEHKHFLLENFFLANWDNMIKVFPRYYELLAKRGFRYTKTDIVRVARYFTDEEFRDLQVLFNLCWIDPMFRTADPMLAELVARGRHYTEDDKRLVIDAQMGILREIIPTYKRFAATGQIELSVTPFFHPILPLLWDTDCARIAMPRVPLPRERFAHPEDAFAQIRMGIDYFEQTFGFRPKGMWPSEGSVSEEVIRAVSREGIQWVATDEEVLARSLGRALRSHEGFLTDAASLYRPYQFDSVSLFFRDHKLSDLIGFVYSGWKPENAVDDFIGKLAQIRSQLPPDRPFVVPIILDGENAWEHFRNDGHDFLRGLYAALSNDDRFRTVTMSDFISEHGKGETLSRVHPGSWINANFGIWIGHEEDNLAWDYLSRTRNDLQKYANEHPEADLTEAWNALYAAEGSDWNWWYGDDHSTETADVFDELFRGYLMKVYQEIGMDAPNMLYVPILLEDRNVSPDSQARGFIYPTIDGYVTSYFEWFQSAWVDVSRSGGSMHKSESLIAAMYYGFNPGHLYLRVDPLTPFTDLSEQITFSINIMQPRRCKIVYRIAADGVAELREKTDNQWRTVKTLSHVAAKDVFEIEIPFADIGAKEHDDLHLAIDIFRTVPDTPTTNGGESMERCPFRGYLIITVPTEDYEKLMWY